MHIKTETIVGIFILSAIIIFFYMSLQIGALRFDTFQYQPYTLYFHDISGLSSKADVHIAGVKVGWVDAISLVDNGQQVKTTILVHKDYVLHSDAYGVIRQDGLLGSKYVDVEPGSSQLPIIKPHGVLQRPSREPVAMDELLYGLKDVVANTGDISASVKAALDGDEGVQKLQQMTHRVDEACTEFAKLTDRLEHAVEPLGEIIEKVNDGKGIIGHLINDEEACHSFTYAINGVRTYFEKIDRLAIIVDGHGENMQGRGNLTKEEDAKGYINLRIHPAEDYFYLIGVVGAQSGFIEREEKFRTWFDCNGDVLRPQELELTDFQRLRFAPKKRIVERKLDRLLTNLQVGKIFGNIALRTGVFESTFGAAIDVNIPLYADTLRWVSSIEAYDFNGRNRIHDDRVHLKWLNKLFLTPNTYVAFGADDFASETNKTAFIGAGLRFADDDVKYVMASVSPFLAG